MAKKFRQFEETVVKEVDGVAQTVEKTTVKFRKTVLERFPILIISLSTFGVVAVLYSFELIIERIPVLGNNPFYVFMLGVLALGITGQLYKKLQ